jgi:hypothetical protein
MNTTTKRPTKKQLAKAIEDVEVSVTMNNTWGETPLTDYEVCAEFAAVDWLNNRQLDNAFAATIVEGVMRRVRQ